MQRSSFFLISSFLFALPAFSETDPCSTLADLKSKSDSSVFVGYSTGSSQKEAEQNAQVELARNIRQKITSTSTVTESNENSTLQSNSKSVVSESIVGASVLRRCALQNGFSAVVTLDKKIFLSSLERKLTSNFNRAANFVSSIEKAKSEEVLAQTVDSAKKFAAQYQSSSENDLDLCKIYDGCSKIQNQNAFDDLANALAKQGDKDQYVFFTKDDVAKSLKEDLISLAEADGLKVMAKSIAGDSSLVKRKILATCKAKVGTKIPGSDDRVVQVQCVTTGYVGKQRTFRNVYTCKAMADSGSTAAEAVNVCSGRLQKE